MSVSLEQPFSAVSGPDTTEIEYRDDQEQLNSPSTIEITNDGDKPYQVDHPWIKGDLKLNHNGLIDAAVEVTVAYPRGHDFTMSFERYLQTIGLNYDRYQTYYKHHQTAGLAADFQRMHQAAIEYRGHTARRLKAKWEQNDSPEKLRKQQESTTVHSYIWRKIFDLGIDGLDAEVPWDDRVDFLDGIDELLFINTNLLSGKEEEDDFNFDTNFAVGIQRSHKDKSREVADDPVRYIPEHPEYGPIFRVFIPDISDLYREIKDKLQEVLNERLSSKALEYNVSRREYLEKMAKQRNISVDEFRDQELESIKISKVLRFGQEAQVRWALKILGSTGEQLESYLEIQDLHEDTIAFQRLQKTIEAVRQAIKIVEKESPAAIREMEKQLEGLNFDAVKK